MRASTEKGFQKALPDHPHRADLASFMGAVLLWYLTVGAVRGFAFFLGLSVILDLLRGLQLRPADWWPCWPGAGFFAEQPVFGVARGLAPQQRRGGGPTAKAKAGAAS